MLPLATRFQADNQVPMEPLKVLSLTSALEERYPFHQVCLFLPDGDQGLDFSAVKKLGLGAVLVDETSRLTASSIGLPTLSSPANSEVVSEGDVIRIAPNGQVRVLYRRGASSNFLFTTARCNSLCLMCSQPPRDEDDSWRVREVIETIDLLDTDIDFIGITGGEPTLLGDGLGQIVKRVRDVLPRTLMHILTNGRAFADVEMVRKVEPVLARGTFAIPLYSDTAQRHDYVVQVKGAYTETLNGILNLAASEHSIEIRHVVHAATLPRLRQFAEFIIRTLSFVDHVALMGMEPMGFAVGNRQLLWVDPLDYAQALSDVALLLESCGIAVSIYNVPLCILPSEAWRLARRSISDWKQTYAEECEGCSVRDQCCGFFKSAGGDWRSRGIRPVKKGEGK